MTQYIGEEVIGADELEELMSEMGIEGTAPNKVPKRHIVGNPTTGRPRAFPFGLPNSGVVLTTATTTMQTNADRDCFLGKLHIASFQAAGAGAGAPEYGALTALSVGGRNALVGAAGQTPLSAFQADSLMFHSFGVIKSGNPVVMTLQNNFNASLTFLASFLAKTID